MGPDGADSERSRVNFNTALGWSYVMQGGQYVISTIVTFVVAAIVGPSVFGLVAMAMVYLMFIQLLVRQGMIPALIQRSELGQKHITSAFWLVMATGIVLTIASVLLSGWWADVNRTPELGPVINALSAVILLQSLIVVQEALLSRRMDFKILAIRTNSAALVGGAVGLVLALIGFGVWALVAQHIAKSVVDVAVLWGLSDWRPSREFSWPAAKELLGFSASTTLAGFGSFVNSRADALLIGLFFGPTAVGLYRLAARLVDVVVQVTVRSFQSVSLPELSRLEGQPRNFADRITDMVNSTSLIALPALGILAGASSMVMAVVGEEWAAAAAPLSVLCVGGAVRVLTMFTGPVAIAVGRPHLLAAVTWLSAAFSAASFLVAGALLRDSTVADQVLGVAVARVALFSTAGLALATWVILRNSDTGLRSLAGAVLHGFLAAVLGFASTGVLSMIPLAGGALLQMVLVVVPSLVLVVALLLWIEPKVRRLFARTTQLVRRA